MTREALEAKYEKVWNTQELQRDFDVLAFAYCYCIVRRKSDNVKGSLDFQHDPRFYFDFKEVR